jgi:hypothetical protein
MSGISFALYEAFQKGASVDSIAETLCLPHDFVNERIEAARLCLVLNAELDFARV